MKIISTVLSIATLAYLISAYLSQQGGSQYTDKLIATPQHVTPVLINNTPLEVERIWGNLITERQNEAQKSSDKEQYEPIEKKDTLSIGDQRYVLYGIFNARMSNKEQKGEISESLKENSFILIRALNNAEDNQGQMLKISIGQDISPGISLVKISTNSFSFQEGSNITQFKLFEAKNQ